MSNQNYLLQCIAEAEAKFEADRARCLTARFESAVRINRRSREERDADCRRFVNAGDKR